MLTGTRREIKNAKAARRRIKYRKKLKSEKETLQTQAAELSTQLERLQVARCSTASANFALRMWKTTATRQKEKRARAEEQRSRLQAAVRSRAKLIHNISGLLETHNRTETPNLYKNDIAEDADAILRTFVCELDSLYAQTSRVFECYDPSTCLEVGPIKRQSDGMHYVEVGQVLVLPFNFDDVCRGFSLFMLADTEGYRMSTADTENIAAGKRQLRCRSHSDESTTVATHYAIRRYCELSRLVFVWRCLHEGHGQFEDHDASEMGWILVQSSLGSTSHCSQSDTPEQSTIVMRQARVIPMQLGNSSNGGDGIDPLAEIIIQAEEDEFKDTIRQLAPSSD